MLRFKSIFIVVKLLIKSLLTLIPGLYKILSGKSSNAKDTRYCYSVVLRHLQYIRELNGGEIPKKVVEIGPGGSLGTGILTLLLGAESYTAIDAKNHLGEINHIDIFKELVELLKAKTPIPSIEFPNLSPGLASYDFPSWLSKHVEENDLLDEKRLKGLEMLLKTFEQNQKAKTNGISMSYVASVDYAKIDKPENVDWIFSQAVMEHVPNVPYVYSHCKEWLRPDGIMSHQIDYKSHGLAVEWNGHWKYSDFLWKLINGKRSYLINRKPHSFHVETLQKIGYKLLKEVRINKTSKYGVKDMNPGCRVNQEDISTSGAFVITQNVKA